MITYQQEKAARNGREGWSIALVILLGLDALGITIVQVHGAGHAFVVVLSALALWALFHVRRTGKVLRAWDAQESAEEAERKARRDP